MKIALVLRVQNGSNYTGIIASIPQYLILWVAEMFDGHSAAIPRN